MYKRNKIKVNCSICGIEMQRTAIYKIMSCFDCKKKRVNEVYKKKLSPTCKNF